jgi:hypothetical protein
MSAIFAFALVGIGVVCFAANKVNAESFEVQTALEVALFFDQD